MNLFIAPASAAAQHCGWLRRLPWRYYGAGAGYGSTRSGSSEASPLSRLHDALDQHPADGHARLPAAGTGAAGTNGEGGGQAQVVKELLRIFTSRVGGSLVPDNVVQAFTQVGCAPVVPNGRPDVNKPSKE